jgi:hypothetical protein
VAGVGKVLVVEDSVEEGADDEDGIVDEDVAEEDDVAKVGVDVASVAVIEVSGFAVVKEAPVDTGPCSVLSAVPLMLLLRNIGTLKIEQSAANKIATVRKSKNFRDLLSMAFD